MGYAVPNATVGYYREGGTNGSDYLGLVVGLGNSPSHKFIPIGLLYANDDDETQDTAVVAKYEAIIAAAETSPTAFRDEISTQLGSTALATFDAMTAGERGALFSAAYVKQVKLGGCL